MMTIHNIYKDYFMSFFTKVGADIKADFQAIWSWLGTEEAQAAALLKPIIEELANVIKNDGLLDLSTAAAAAATAIATGTPVGGLIAIVLPALEATVEKQASTVSSQALNALAQAVVAGAVANAPVTTA